MRSALIFLGGVAVGGLTTTLYFKRKIILLEEEYQQITNDEINNFINEYNNSSNDYDDDECMIDNKGDVTAINNTENMAKWVSDISKRNTDDTQKVVQIIEENKYVVDEEPDENNLVALYTITPDEYGDNDEYDTKTLTLFTNRVVLDEDDCIFDIDYFGEDVLKKLYSKKIKDKSIFVRDDNEKIDYEVIKENIDYDTFLTLKDTSENN